MRRALAAALALSLAACTHDRPSRPAPPPVPLTDPDPHAEPDLVGAVHVVKKGETLYRIAKAYGISPRELMELNDIRDARHVEIGTELFIPGAAGVRDVPAVSPGAAPEPEEDVTRGRPAPFQWPVKGVLYSRFGVRQGQRHDGIDIAAPEGTAIGAAAAGAVIYAGEQAGYGWIVILRHASGLLTLYAHASAVLVRQGDRVEAGSPVARVGRSGRTTGPHLHFEVREGTRPRNPLFYLP
jgi:murein DD-endopeptidase MepM/ murein hydrolase activator NlpD